MLTARAVRQTVMAVCLSFVAATAFAQTKPEPYKPQSGQEGKDVVWVPTPQPLVEKILWTAPDVERIHACLVVHVSEPRPRSVAILDRYEKEARASAAGDNRTRPTDEPPVRTGPRRPDGTAPFHSSLSFFY